MWTVVLILYSSHSLIVYLFLYSFFVYLVLENTYLCPIIIR